MAKEKKDKAKIRVFLAEVEGNNDTIREALRTITETARTFQPNVKVIRLISQEGSADQGKLLTQDEDKMVIDLDLEDDQKGNLDDKYDAPTRKKQPKTRSFTPPEMMELDLISGELPFERYCAQKNPQSHLQKYLVIASWLKQYRSIAPIGTQHIYTVYTVMKWPTLNDLDSGFRNSLKRKGGKEFRRVAKGEYEMTIAGENAVRRMGG